MNQSRTIAFRNVGRQRKRSYLLAGAIGFGFLIITIVGSLTNGMADAARNNFSHLLGGHLYFSGSVVSELGSEINQINDAKPLETVLATFSDRILAVHKRSSSTGSLIFGTQEIQQKIQGVDFGAEKDFRDNVQIVAGSLDKLTDPSSLVLPDDKATKLGITVGETVIFKNTTVTGQQNVTELVLIATVASQSNLGMSSGYANLATINTTLGMSAGQYQSINVWLKNMDDIDNLASQMYAKLKAVAAVSPRAISTGDLAKDMMSRMMGAGGLKSIAKGDTWTGTKFSLSTLNELMSQFISIIAIIDQIAFWIFIILVVITMVGIMNSYRMVMVERTGEIGTMRAIGVQRGGIRDIFLWEAFFIAALGAVGGFVLAMVVMGLAGLPVFNNVSILSLFLDKGHFHFRIWLPEVLQNALIICVMSLVAVWFPARTASRLEPALALRTVY